MSVRQHPRKGEGWWVIDCRPDGVKGPRKRLPFKGAYEEACAFESALMTGSTYKVKSTMTVKELTTPWLAYYQNYAAVTTVIDAKGAMSHWLPIFGPLRPKNFSPDLIEQYKSLRLGEGAKKRTINKELSYFSSMIRWAVEYGHCEALPFRISSFPKKQTTPRKPRPLTQEQVTGIIEAIEPEYRLLVMLMADTGLRLSEARFLQRKDIDFETGLIFVVGKGSKERIVPITTDRLAAELLAKKDIDGYLSVNSKTKKPFFSIKKALDRAAVKAGLDRHVHHHLLRHSFGTNATVAGVDLKALQGMMGHSSPVTTGIYQHLAAGYLKEQAVKLNSRVHVDASE
ncbi:tyrosine-type recombinase/integrase [Desulfogranum marinum]|uniref:tyrosine-type recombinase/integrase n=1 Tax=Desulfogranum marinum TaxID=453220 RepID=UPI0029C62E21|nr:tyrosine-type recombinase/integrase [Desulfogranum marinum]